MDKRTIGLTATFTSDLDGSSRRSMERSAQVYTVADVVERFATIYTLDGVYRQEIPTGNDLPSGLPDDLKPHPEAPWIIFRQTGSAGQGVRPAWVFLRLFPSGAHFPLHVQERHTVATWHDPQEIADKATAYRLITEAEQLALRVLQAKGIDLRSAGVAGRLRV